MVVARGLGLDAIDRHLCNLQRRRFIADGGASRLEAIADSSSCFRLLPFCLRLWLSPRRCRFYRSSAETVGSFHALDAFASEVLRKRNEMIEPERK